MHMTTIVGIFDSALDLEKAVARLSRAGFDDTVYDAAIIGGEASDIGSLVFAPGHAPAVAWGSIDPAFPRRPGQQAAARALKRHLAEYDLPDEAIETYARMFCHDGEFVLVKPTASMPNRLWRSCRSAVPCG
jgi:hypothetical protein